MKTPSSSRIIPGEHVTEAIPFDLGALPGGRGAGRRLGASAHDDAPLDPMRQGFEIGFRRGLAEGAARARRAAQAEREMLGGSLAERMDALLAAAEHEFEAFREHAAQRIVELALDVARQVVRSTPAIAPEAIVPVVQEALAAQIESDARSTLALHPDDVAAVADALAPVLERRGIALHRDPAIRAGGCRLTSAHATIDATIETRWARVMEAIGHPQAGPLPE